MIGRQTLMRRCRYHRLKPATGFCFYCHRKNLTDKHYGRHLMKPEERLLAQIFGESRHLQAYSKGFDRRSKRMAREAKTREWRERRANIITNYFSAPLVMG